MAGLKWSSSTQSCTRCLIILLILQTSQILGRSVDNFDVGYQWAHINIRNGVPSNAVQGGQDTGGQAIYVGRALHEGDLIPAKVIPAYKQAFVPYGGVEHDKYDIEVLVQSGATFQWVTATNGDVPPNALVGGYNVYGETLFIGRAAYMGSKTVGKVQVTQRGMYMAYGGKEIYFPTYEILVRN